MSKAGECAASMTPDEMSVLLRMEAGVAIAPGAWTLADYEIIERSPTLYRPMYVSKDFGFGHTLTLFGRRVQAKAIEARRAATTGAVGDESAVAKPFAQGDDA